MLIRTPDPTVMRTLVLASLAVVWTSAAAQSVQFRPLAVGDTWTYAARRVSSSTSSPCTLPTAVTDYVRADVLRDTTLNGVEARVVGCTQTALNGTALSTGRLAVPLTFGSVVALSGSTSCEPVFTPGPSTSLTSTVVQIGERPYTMGAVAIDNFGGGSCGFSGGHERTFGDLVGKVVDREYRRQGCGNTMSTCSDVRYDLAYAVVGGTAYGTRPVAGEEVPAGAALGGLRAYPVPAGLTVTVETVEAAAVEVVDALGRRVASGEASPGRPLLLDVSAWAPGVYVARATAAGGTARTARIVVSR